MAKIRSAVPDEETDKRQELLRQAIVVFSGRGYRATSMNDLAEQVGLSKSTLYHYFRSKQDLLVAIYDGVVAENIAAAKRITTNEKSVVDSLRQMLADRVAYTCDHHRILQIFHEEESELPNRLLSKVVKSKRDYQKVMTDLLEQGLAEGVFAFNTTPMIVANCLLGSCNWSYKWYKPEGKKSTATLAAEVSELLMGSVLAPTARLTLQAGPDRPKSERIA
jgi:TetR/AcrR family transcriptional regulator, cholesterol catabolism regulator